jgi:hypothetical protein
MLQNSNSFIDQNFNNKLTPWSRTNIQNPATFSWPNSPLPVIESEGSNKPFQYATNNWYSALPEGPYEGFHFQNVTQNTGEFWLCHAGPAASHQN